MKKHKALNTKVSKLVHEGKPIKQAVAIAYAMKSRKDKRKPL